MSPPKGWKKPNAPLLGANGNAFSVMGIAARAIKERAGEAVSKQYFEDVKGCHSYDALLALTLEWVEPVSARDTED